MNWHDELNEVSQRTSGGKEVFQKKPFGRRWYLISGAVTRREFSTTTSGTERERGFVGILPCRSAHPITYFIIISIIYHFNTNLHLFTKPVATKKGEIGIYHLLFLTFPPKYFLKVLKIYEIML